MRRLAERIASIRTDFEGGVVPRQTESRAGDEVLSSAPLLREMEATVSLIPEAFVGSQSLRAYALPERGETPSAALFRPDWLSNSDHFKFGLKGCLAASLCYITYNLLDWPGISTAVTTVS
jgi:multidrug resistance protein MdtO